MIMFPKWEVNMCKIVLAILASLALAATLEVGYVVYLKNTVTATRDTKERGLETTAHALCKRTDIR